MGRTEDDRLRKGWSLGMVFALILSTIVGLTIIYDRIRPDHPLISAITGFGERNYRQWLNGVRIDRFTRPIEASFEEFPFIHSAVAEFQPTAKDAAEFISMPTQELPSAVHFPFPGSYVVRCKPKYTPARVTENRTAKVSEILALPKGLSYLKTEEIDNDTSSLTVHFKHGHQEKLGAE